MSIAKVIEVIAEGDSVNDAIKSGVKKASKSVKNIRSAWVDGIQARVEDGEVVSYRVNLKLTFVIDD